MISTAQDEYVAARQSWLASRRPQILRTALRQTDRWLERLEVYNLEERGLPPVAQVALARFLADSGVEVDLHGRVDLGLEAIFQLQARLMGRLVGGSFELDEEEDDEEADIA